MPNSNVVVQLSDYWGYRTADPGDDFNRLFNILDGNPSAQPTQLTVWSGSRVDAVQMVYGSNSLNKLGGGSGKAGTLNLTPVNPVRSIEFYGAEMSPDRLGQIVIIMQDGIPHTYGTTPKEQLGTFTLPTGFQLGGFWGYFGSEVNGLGLILIPLP